MKPAQAELVRILAQVAVADFVTKLEAEADDNHSEDDRVSIEREFDASTPGKAT